MDQREFEQLVQAITEEIAAYLGTPASEVALLDPRAGVNAGAARLSGGSAVCEVDSEFGHLIDHTLLKPEASRNDIIKLCQEARRFCFASVCVNAWYVPLAAELLRGTPVKVCTVVGFPLGATLPRVKVYETEEAIKLGAQEIDMVQNVGALKSGQDDQVELDIRGVVQACRRGGAICKVILETALLTPEEKVRACQAAMRAGADFVKTSTGFGPGGATAEDVALMHAVVGTAAEVKAAGGIRTLEDVKKMVSAGATRIGASASVRIVEQEKGIEPPVASSSPPPGPALPQPAKSY
jgi:deoxyribose-phosphate aldolase